MTFLRWGLVLTFLVTHLIGPWDQKANAVQNGSTKDELGKRVLDFRTIDRTTGSPLADVTLEIQIHGQDRQNQKLWKEKTSAQGQCKIQLPDFQIRALRIYPQKEGFVPLRIFWSGDPTPPDIPQTFTVAIEPGRTIGGTVQNEQDQPIQDVTVSIFYMKDDPKAAENARVNIDLVKVRTDIAGQWTFNRMPAKIDKNELRIFLTHPDYLSDNLRPGYIPMPITRQPSIESLRDLSGVMVMKEGLEVSGMVTDTRGKPIAGAKIYDIEDYWWRSTKPVAETDAQGRFRSNANPGTATWTVQAAGYAPDLRVVTIKAGMQSLEFRLEPGQTIEGKVTDQAGQPIEDARISAEEWRNNRRRLHLEAKTDANGTFKIADAPSDGITFDIGKEGYMMLEKYPMQPGKGNYTITLRPTLKVRGSVLDAQTGQPISKFTVTNGFDYEDGRAPQWEKYSVRTFTGGQYEMEYRQEIFTYRLRIDAEGYQSAISGRIRPEEISQSTIVCDFKLDKATPLEGIVLSPDGTPLSGADVVIATNWLHITNGKIDSRSSEQNLVHCTDSSGRFPFKTPIGPYAIVVLSTQGYAKVMPDEFTASRTITLSPWGCIEGTLRIGAQPGIDKFIVFLPKTRRQQEYPRIYFEYEAQTDKNGHFTFPQLPSGEGTVARAIPIDAHTRRYSYHIGVDVKSGQTTRVQVGGTGRPVIGKVIIPDLIENVFDWQHTDGSLRVSSSIHPPYKILAVLCDKDGSFRVDDVPAGDYCLYMHAYAPPPNTRSPRGELIGVLTHPFTIPEMPGGRSDEPLDLGELEFEVLGKTALMPSLVGKPLPDMNDIKIDFARAQAQGEMLLVCLFDMNQRPSRHRMIQLTKQAEQLKNKDLTVIAVQASKIEQEALNQWVKEYNVPFPVGMVQDNAEKFRFAWGVKSLPWLILTDRTHIVCAEGFSLGELDDKVSLLGDKQ